MGMTRAERVAAFLRDIAGEEGVAAMRIDEAAATAMHAERRKQESALGIERLTPPIPAARINAGLEAVALGRELPAESRAALEAIIIPDKRPVMPLQGGTYTATQPL